MVLPVLPGVESVAYHLPGLRVGSGLPELTYRAVGILEKRQPMVDDARAIGRGTLPDVLELAVVVRPAEEQRVAARGDPHLVPLVIGLVVEIETLPGATTRAFPVLVNQAAILLE